MKCIDGYSNNKKLLIVGASGHGRVVADIALKMNRWQEIAYLDNNSNLKTSMDIQVIGNFDEAFKYINDYDIFIAIGNNKIRALLQSQLERVGASIPTIIHPNAIIGKNVEFGVGTVVMAGTVINCCSRIGKGCIINTGATIDHDNVLENYVHISPGVHTAGTVHICKGTWIGIGAIISNNVKIVSGCTIGAGAVVVKDITEVGVYVGIPAKRLSANNKLDDLEIINIK